MRALVAGLLTVAWITALCLSDSTATQVLANNAPAQTKAERWSSNPLASAASISNAPEGPVVLIGLAPDSAEGPATVAGLTGVGALDPLQVRASETLLRLNGATNQVGGVRFFTQVLRIQLVPDVDLAAILDRLRALPSVAFAEPGAQAHVIAAPMIPFLEPNGH